MSSRGRIDAARPQVGHHFGAKQIGQLLIIGVVTRGTHPRRFFQASQSALDEVHDGASPPASPSSAAPASEAIARSSLSVGT